MGSLDGVELVESLDGVDLNLTLFASFYVPSILLSVENFDAFSHFDLDLSQPELSFYYDLNLFFLYRILHLLLLVAMLLILMMLFLLILLLMFF
jgi:hypothetical protein